MLPPFSLTDKIPEMVSLSYTCLVSNTNKVSHIIKLRQHIATLKAEESSTAVLFLSYTCRIFKSSGRVKQQNYDNMLPPYEDVNRKVVLLLCHNVVVFLNQNNPSAFLIFVIYLSYFGIHCINTITQSLSTYCHHLQKSRSYPLHKPRQYVATERETADFCVICIFVIYMTPNRIVLSSRPSGSNPKHVLHLCHYIATNEPLSPKQYPVMWHCPGRIHTITV